MVWAEISQQSVIHSAQAPVRIAGPNVAAAEKEHALTIADDAAAVSNALSYHVVSVAQSAGIEEADDAVTISRA